MMLSRLPVLAALSVPVFSGSFTISIGDPSQSKDPAARGAIATFRLSDFSGPADNNLLSVSAEGLIGAERVSIPIQLVQLKEAGLSAVTWTKPAYGTWVLRFKLGSERYAYIPVGSAGVQPQTQPMAWAESDETDKILADLATGRVITAKR